MLRAGGLGSFVGKFCYVCEDTEPCTEMLDQRMRGLVQRSSAWGGLRRQLLELRMALTDPNIHRSEEGLRLDSLQQVWEAVDVQERIGFCFSKC
jgi:hypothetical protein